MKEPIVSLCLPTNGIIEWVFPVLDSIYNQNVKNDLYEVIVTDNGDNSQFEEMMQKYVKKHDNLIYKKTDASMFYNQLEALKLASGTYLKFVNHRGIFIESALEKMINIISENKEDKPVIYFGNGALKNDRYVLNSFDAFVGALKRYVSWTTGVGIWKSDYQKIPDDVRIDKISPHSCILFAERKKAKYLIENFIFSKDIDTDASKKGTYDLFKAFAVEEVTIALNLFIDGDITAETFKLVKKDYRDFVSELYYMYVIKKEACSYDLNGFDNSMGVFFTRIQIFSGVICLMVKKTIKKVMRIMGVVK